MRKLWNAFKYLAPVTPLYWMKKHYMQAAEQDDLEQDLTSQLETHTYKIFLTPEISQFSDLKIFAFDAEILGKEVATYLDTTLGRHITTRFNDGEISIQVLDLVRGHDVYIVKSFQDKNIDDGIMELILAVSCMKKSGAEKVTAIIPFFPYSTTTSAVSEEINQGRDFHTCFAADIVKMLEASGCDQIVTLNSLINNPKGFCDRSTFLNVDTPQLAVPYLIHTKMQNPIIVGSQVTQNYLRNVAKLRNSFKLFGYECQLGFFNDVNYIGENIKGKDVLLYNNLLRTGNSTKKHVKLLRKMGARYIYVYGFHGLCKNETFDQLIKSLPIEQLIMTNTIFHAHENKKIRTISVAKLLAQIISILHEQKSFSAYRSERQLLKYAFLQKIKSLNSNYKSVSIDNNYDQTIKQYEEKDGMPNVENSNE